jgi:hypothetical protein
MSIAFNSEDQTGAPRRNLLAYSTQFSTRFLLETVFFSSPGLYTLEFAPLESDFLRAVNSKKFDAYIIDTSDSEGEERFRLLREITALKPKGITRILLLLDKMPPPNADHMESFGPLCFLECFFTRQRLLGSLNRIFDMKDTGSRVKADDKFFDVTVFSKNK